MRQNTKPRVGSAKLLSLGLSLLSAWCVSGLRAQPAQADIVNYTVNIDTSSLQGLGGQTFGFDFQLNNLNGVANERRVSASNFNFNGGSAGTVDTANNSGNVSGSAPSGINLVDQTGFNEFAQGFTPGGLLSYTLQVDTNLLGASNPTNSTSPQADLFRFSLFNQDGFLTSNDPNGGNPSLFSISFDSFNNPTVSQFTTQNNSTDAFNGITANVTVTPVPEPGSMALMLIGLGGLVVGKKRKRKADDLGAPLLPI